MVGLNGLVDIAGDIVRGASSIAGRLSTLIRTPETLALQLQSLYQQLGLAIKRPKSAMADLRTEYGSMTLHLGQLPSDPCPRPRAPPRPAGW